ncbi:MAG TPA: hypothetical protein PLL06_03745 [Acidobacteriota bacterium]|nr:hypothetical protein [Acidobacteriota bacterium]HMZ78789.1 hypothetical protein [Acidobacteriota bacterium]HNB73771.1 hypothetical protein [Acidobacteriota bacterium]HNC43148.1 hypothetical protein [Acidobacteriota bacterium]HNG92433.1 hypothetical protein [Acidobacteriota bacterium]
MKSPVMLLKLLVFLLFTCPIGAQQIPKGVNYKPAPDAVNSEAKAELEKALKSPQAVPKTIIGPAFCCGPMLWKSFSAQANQTLQDANPVIVMIPAAEPVIAQARAIRTEQEQASFWKTLWATYPELKDGLVRKAKAEELSYYWATISFDIEEPFFVIETAKNQFVVHFQMESGTPRLFWIDVVGDFRNLKR